MTLSCNRIARQAVVTQRGVTRYLACLLFLSAAMSVAGRAQAQGWRTASDKDGIRMETRRIAGGRFDELRVSTSLKASPDVIADYLFGKYLDEKNKNIHRTFITREQALTIWSDVLRTPVTSERCYSMRFERQAHANGEIRVKFASFDYVGRTPVPDCVALRARGEWIMTPTHTGTRLVYASLTDIGGKVPAALARRSLSAAAISSVGKVVAGASGLALQRGIGD
ncbi:MAG: hypothetical protein LH470_08235 [Lysobacter sp.]|nr:hypothetical protein [Lysobacter sp.]